MCKSNRYTGTNVKFPLCLIKHHAMKKYGGVEVQFHILISALDGGECSASRLNIYKPERMSQADHIV
jgi:hypothetical protein